MAFSAQANYTDGATATCRRNLVLTFANRGVSRGKRGRSRTVINLSFLERNTPSLSQHNEQTWRQEPLKLRPEFVLANENTLY
jgi:hypothetical protein